MHRSAAEAYTWRTVTPASRSPSPTSCAWNCPTRVSGVSLKYDSAPPVLKQNNIQLNLIAGNLTIDPKDDKPSKNEDLLQILTFLPVSEVS